MDCGPPGPSVHGISQARMLQWVVISFPRASFWPRDRLCVSCIRQADSLPLSPQGSPTETHRIKSKLEMYVKLIFKMYLSIFGCQLLVAAHRIFIASCGIFRQSTGTLCVVPQLGCSTACGILVSRPGIKAMCPALEGGFIITGPPGKSLRLIFFKAT